MDSDGAYAYVTLIKASQVLPLFCKFRINKNACIKDHGGEPGNEANVITWPIAEYPISASEFILDSSLRGITADVTQTKFSAPSSPFSHMVLLIQSLITCTGTLTELPSPFQVSPKQINKDYLCNSMLNL